MFKVFLISSTCFIIIHLIHFLFFEINVVLYAALFDATLAPLITLSILYFKGFLRKIQTLCVIISFLCFFIYSILIPTALDRSLSLYILRHIEYNPTTKVTDLHEIVKKDYFIEMQVIEQRINEQIKTGTISVESGCINLTTKGKIISKFSRFYKNHFLKNLVHN